MEMATRISENFALEELRDSATAKRLGIINVPGVDEVCPCFYAEENM